MNQEQVSGEIAELEISNIGGIEGTTTALESGISVLVGKNATNRTSLLQAIMTACGSENVALKADAESGYVELTIDGETYRRTLTRQGGTVTFEGEGYLDDPAVADLFAFLLENNEARQAVAQGDDLREIIMRPVDTNEIEREISRLESERENVDEELDRLNSLSERVPELEEEKQRLEAEIAETEAELEEKNQEIEELDATIEEERGEKQEYEKKLNELRDKRQELQDVERSLKSERESIESLEEEREETKEQLDELDTVSDERISQIEQDVHRLRGQVQQIDSTVNELQSVISFNEDFVEGDGSLLTEVLDDRSNDEAITDQLVSDTEEVVCWTCGSDVKSSQIESTLNQLRTFRNDRMNDRQGFKDQIGELQSEKSTLETKQQNREQIEQKLPQIESEIDQRRTTVDNLEDQKEEISEAISALDEEVDELEGADQSEILEAQKEASQFEVELDRLERDLENVEGELEKVESELAGRDEREQRREEISSELTDLRTRVEDLQEQAIEEFNDHMDAVLERLSYENIERIWIERTKEEVREGRRKITKDRFTLHIVRASDSGTVYEDTVDHLSESEREVTGLVFALAGYLVHNVYDYVPFMLLDSIEAIDSDRIARLIDYLGGYADYLVVALLEEDAAALDDSYPRIESI